MRRRGAGKFLAGEARDCCFWVGKTTPSGNALRKEKVKVLHKKPGSTHSYAREG